MTIPRRFCLAAVVLGRGGQKSAAVAVARVVDTSPQMLSLAGALFRAFAARPKRDGHYRAG
jgi:hypothetical protein